jgi:hypothetical protein
MLAVTSCSFNLLTKLPNDLNPTSNSWVPSSSFVKEALGCGSVEREHPVPDGVGVHQVFSSAWDIVIGSWDDEEVASFIYRGSSRRRDGQ